MLIYFNLYANWINCSPVCLTVAIPGGLLHLHTQLCDVFDVMERILFVALCSLERNATVSAGWTAKLYFVLYSVVFLVAFLLSHKTQKCTLLQLSGVVDSKECINQ